MRFDFNNLISLLKTRETTLVSFDAPRRRVTQFHDVYLDVVRTMAFLRSHGVRAGDRVGIVGRNCYEWCVADLACLGIGAIVVAFDKTNLRYLDDGMQKFELSLLLHDTDKLDCICPNVFSFRDALTASCFPENERNPTPHEFRAGAVISVKFTSGSTGDAKAMEVGRESVEDTISSVQAMFQHGAHDRILIFLPLHLIQQRYWIYAAIFYGAHVVLCPYELAMGLLRSECPTVIMGVPGFFEALEKSYCARTSAAERSLEHFGSHLGGAIRYLWTGSAGMAQTTLDFFGSMQVPIYQGYGSNETCIVSKNYPGHNKSGSVGQLLPNREIQFDSVGQILVKPKYPVAYRYLDEPEAVSRRVFLPDGFVATGDIGELDAAGYLYIRGRIKEVIVLSSGRKVNPHRIEAALGDHLDVLHCFVHGNERPYLVALLCVRPGRMTRTKATQLVARVNEGLTVHDRIYGFDVLEEDFSTENGLLNAQLKLRRDKIVERYSDRITALYKGAN